MRVLVCGGRAYDDWATLDQVLCDLWDRSGRFLVVIHGGAKGADALASRWCSLAFGEAEEMVFTPDWKQYGRGAGPIRNQQMLDEGKPDLVLAFPGGKGTTDMVRRAELADIPVQRVEATA